MKNKQPHLHIRPHQWDRNVVCFLRLLVSEPLHSWGLTGQIEGKPTEPVVRSEQLYLESQYFTFYSLHTAAPVGHEGPLPASILWWFADEEKELYALVSAAIHRLYFIAQELQPSPWNMPLLRCDSSTLSCQFMRYTNTKIMQSNSSPAINPTVMNLILFTYCCFFFFSEG